mgnify:FL=1
MLAVSLRTLRALTTTGVLVALSASAQAQFYDPCNVCAPPVTVMANPCACLQPVTETVQKEVQVTAYHDEERTIQRPVIRTAWEEREVTAYRTVYEPRTAEVPSVAYQQQTECRQVTQDRSFWRTNWQPVPKLSPCQVDPRPGLAGELNRLGYSMRMAFTPNYIPRREFVPNVVAYNVPTTRTVAVPTTRTVTYNVAKLEPYTTTQRVARQVVDMVDTKVTVRVPHTETRTVSVPVTRYAYVDPYGRGSISAARTPTPARSADADHEVDQRAELDYEQPSASEGDFKLQNYRRPKAPANQPRLREVHARPAPTPAAEPADTSVTTARPVPTAVRVAGWRPSRHAKPAQIEGPVLSVAAK